MRLSRLLVPLSIWGALSMAAVFAQPSFERDVEPIFKTNCYSCHGGTAMVGLDLRTATSILRGSHEGPVVAKHAPEASLLYRKVSRRMMPPPAFNLKLTDSEIDTVRRWIEAGAPSDEEATIAAKREEETARFEELALPIFEDRCFACHAADQPMGGLDLRTVQSVLKGSEGGPVISDLGSIKSILIRKLTSREMPPPGMGQPLSDGEIRTLARWIDASDFRLLRPHLERTSFNPAEAPPVTEEDRQFWSFRKPVAAPVPQVKNRKRVRTPIDAFLLKRLESEGLGFSPDASKLTLLRRAWLDLIGVPPSPKDIRAHLEDKRPDAYERLIDTLLESKHYGERWGRHWLDAAGYSDVTGFDSAVENVIVIDGMWRYRDWVIRAFNQDLPYDRFLVEQLAGDELVDWRSAEKYTPEILDKLVATGYLRSVFDRTDQDVVNLVGERYDVLFHLMEKVSTGLMGLTMGCARCHSHKYDPIPQKDYYRMLSVFASGYNPVRWLQPKNHHLPSVSKREQEAIERHNAEIDKPVAKLKERLEAVYRPYRENLLDAKLKELPENIRPETKEALATPEGDRNEVQKFLASKFEEQLTVTPEEMVKALNEEHLATHKKLSERIRILDGYRRSWNKIQALWEVAAPPKIRLLQRGEVERPGPPVRPGFLEVVSRPGETDAVRPPETKGETSGHRLAFARWLARSDHPLTARVFVNQVWQHHFGRGIVETQDNFGKQGKPPSHPELLDWLAVEFVREGWSVKKLHQLIMTSTVYRQSSEGPAAGALALRADPGNRLLWRMNLRRLEAEILRDSMMATSGKLDWAMGGPPVEGPLMADGLKTLNPHTDSPGEPADAQATGIWRRSVYLLARRYYPLGFLETFDAPLMQTNCSRRMNSVSPLQSLTLMNDDFVVENAQAFAQRVAGLSHGEPGEAIENAYLLALSRRPSREEAQIAGAHLARQKDLYLKANAEEAVAEKKALESLCHLLFLTNEFFYIG